MAAKAAVDYIASALLAAEAEKAASLNGKAHEMAAASVPSLAQTEQVEEKQQRPFYPRKRENVVFEGRTTESERKKYPGLYRLAIITLEWMEPQKLYALSEIKDYMIHTGHPASSGSGVLHALLSKGYVERPMKALYKRVK